MEQKKPLTAEEKKQFHYWVDNRPGWFCERVTANEIITYPTHCEIKKAGRTVLIARVNDIVGIDDCGQIYVTDYVNPIK